MKRLMRGILPSFGLAIIGSLAATQSAYATADVSDIAQNMVTSASLLPSLISAFSYLLAIVFAVTGILKIKDHVENPRQTQLSEGIIRFLAGGGLFALPIVYEAMRVAIGTAGGGGGGGGGTFSIFNFISSVFSLIPGAATSNFNGVLTNIIDSISLVPSMLAAVAYLLGLILGISAILKVKEHVENPAQVGLRESVIRFLIGGAMFSLPTVMTAVRTTITGNGTAAGIGNAVTDILGALSAYLGGANCDPTALAGAGGVIGGALGGLLGGGGLGGGLGGLLGGGGGGNTVGDSICSTMAATTVLPSFLTALSYMFGIILVMWGLMKIKDHVINPSQHPLWDGAIRLIAGGMFFSLPYVVSVAKNTIGLILPFMTTAFGGTASGGGLDTMMSSFVSDIYGPMLFVMNFFGYISGTILVMIGISRLLKSTQEGPRGPGGLGTLMTFLVGGCLLSLSPMISAFTTSIFSGDPLTHTNAVVAYGGLTATETAHVTSIISSILKFMIVLGFISFARGLFIVREVAEGNQQASITAGITHIIGGALAVNLGPLLNVIQTTFGITGYGISFS